MSILDVFIFLLVSPHQLKTKELVTQARVLREALNKITATLPAEIRTIYGILNPQIMIHMPQFHCYISQRKI